MCAKCRFETGDKLFTSVMSLGGQKICVTGALGWYLKYL
jgi:hypothetical protein